MESIQISPRLRYLTVFFIILLTLTSIHATATATLFMLEGRSNSKHLESGADQQQQENDEKGAGKMKVGSRPPTCDSKKYCSTTDNCGRCEAIQVPIIVASSTQQASAAATNTRSDAISNYKPMCWKCKCGNFTFNP